MKILVIEPDVHMQSVLVEALVDHDVVVAANADEAILQANENSIDLVVLELSLGGHSGMEFVYEFRTYSDWQVVPIVLYSSVKLDDDVLRSRGWQQLDIKQYLYKPEANLQQLKEAIER